ncbi:hypothetical protein WA026_006252 [Henosepilachna vigintioctopunctata]|uniref:Uncharacterized protein n=1 Tax=Henosepilachna vigintioctopunctata TaxID=420089 RepID=A0AAW1TI34_9CUCU
MDKFQPCTETETNKSCIRARIVAHEEGGIWAGGLCTDIDPMCPNEDITRSSSQFELRFSSTSPQPLPLGHLPPAATTLSIYANSMEMYLYILQLEFRWCFCWRCCYTFN